MVIISSFHATWANESFYRNALLSDIGENLYQPGNAKVSFGEKVWFMWPETKHGKSSGSYH